MQKTLGGDRLGSGNKQKVSLKEYDRSTHDLGNKLKTSMAVGTLVPVFTEVGLPGDTFDIDLGLDAMTAPTVGPLFGSFKMETHVFEIPIRLFQRQLQINKRGIGFKMNTVRLPQVKLEGKSTMGLQLVDDNLHVNPSSIMSYLNIRGLGHASDGTGGNTANVKREFNAVPWLGYFEIFKQYYANQQENDAYIIHNDLEEIQGEVVSVVFVTRMNPTISIPLQTTDNDDVSVQTIIRADARLIVEMENMTEEFDVDRLTIKINDTMMYASEVFETWTWNGLNELVGTGFRIGDYTTIDVKIGYYYFNGNSIISQDLEPRLVKFPLNNIDTMRNTLLTYNSDAAYVIDTTAIVPYKHILGKQIDADGIMQYALTSNQEGLLVKCYNSDLFNNWLNTEWISGPNGINDITRVLTDGDGGFTINQLNLKNKIFNMMNRIAVSGGDYEDWIDVNWTVERKRLANSPIYHGGLIKKLVFQEVTSTASTETEPLGQLAGKGRMKDGEKGGKLRIKCDEHCYIMAITSITPIIDYSQGNKWDTSLKTMDDFHKPALDKIEFQELITDQMDWRETGIAQSGVIQKMSAGKQPAWSNYQTNVDYTRGNFAEPNSQMFMTLNRRYEAEVLPNGRYRTKDITTYIDPVKWNYIFAYTRRDAQNFWVESTHNITARRLMSANQIPNL